jgi:uncharacterized protein YeaO (DUF488 family)
MARSRTEPYASGRRRRRDETALSRRKISSEAWPPEDGVRILVDRLWPRGLSKEKAAVDHWMKDIAPSADLRKWFGHDPERRPEFRRRYRGELKRHGALLAQIGDLAAGGAVTLLYAAHEEEHNDAVVLREVLVKGLD